MLCLFTSFGMIRSSPDYLAEVFDREDDPVPVAVKRDLFPVGACPLMSRLAGPLHAEVTAFLLARGADPLRPFNGITVIAEAETRGHWLAAEIMRAWTGRRGQPSGQEEGSR